MSDVPHNIISEELYEMLCECFGSLIIDEMIIEHLESN
tara:strand:- start:659 stop:772 length:114 start_codon:yes stop_codon:yes gene_type:complete